jgi:hypothetical protein
MFMPDSNDKNAPSSLRDKALSVEDTPSESPSGSINQTRVCPSAPRNEGGLTSRQAGEEASKCVVLGAENSGDVLPEDDCGVIASGASNIVNCICDLTESQGKVAAVIVE